NETRFLDYHRLGSTVRILADAASNGSGPVTPNASVATATSAEGNKPAEPDVPAQAAPAAASAATQTEPAVAAATPPPAAPPPPPAEPAIPEVSMGAITALPDRPTDAGADADGGFSIKVTSRLVDVGLVAYDKKGRPVTDLKPDDLEIYDNGHKQEIRSFG